MNPAEPYGPLDTTSGRRDYLDGPLPPLPRSYSDYESSAGRNASDSHLVTPLYDDSVYHSSQPAYRESSKESRRYQKDLFNDSYEIQLEPRRSKPDYRASTYIAGTDPDPFSRDISSEAPARKRRRKRLHSGKIPWAVYALTVIQVAVFIGEIARNGILTGSPIEIHPQFNPMIGPSYYVLINMGARYVPCMRNQDEIQNAPETIYWPCPNQTTTVSTCSLSDLCGFSGVPNPKINGSLTAKPAPDQWWRFITPIFLHAGIIHIGFNMLLQMLLGKDMERQIGPVRFLLVYFSSGIFGFVMGGNFAPPGIASTGASGALFGIIALTLLDLLYTWRYRQSPIKDLMFIILDIAISFVLGLLPGVDNFSHIGGFVMGLALGVCILHSPPALRRKTGELEILATSSGQEDTPLDGRGRSKGSNRNDLEATPPSDFGSFFKSPVGFFSGRKALWWAWWLLRAGFFVGVIVAFILLITNFYNHHSTTCTWCKYLSCLPVNNWCDIGYIQLVNQTSTTSHTRALF